MMPASISPTTRGWCRRVARLPITRHRARMAESCSSRTRMVVTCMKQPARSGLPLRPRLHRQWGLGPAPLGAPHLVMVPLEHELRRLQHVRVFRDRAEAHREDVVIVVEVDDVRARRGVGLLAGPAEGHRFALAEGDGEEAAGLVDADYCAGLHVGGVAADVPDAR